MPAFRIASCGMATKARRSRICRLGSRGGNVATGIGKSESGGSRAFDSYDLIEWVAAQPWCDGNVGMVGISGFGAEQFMAAKLNPPHLKATFPFDPRGAYGEAGGFRDEYPGGVIHLFRFLLQVYAAAQSRSRCLRNGKSCGRRRSPIPTSRCTRTSTTCWRSRGNTSRDRKSVV